MNFFVIFVLHKRSVIFFVILVILLGYSSYSKIPKESNPDVKIAMIYVLITQDGISPEDSQRMLLKPMEIALRSIVGIKTMTSYADEGSGSIILEFWAGFDSDKALDDVRNKVNDTISKLPTDAKRPDVKQVDLSLIPVLNVILTGDIPERSFLKIARDLRDDIEGITDVLEVNIGGDRDDLCEIVIDPKQIEKLGLSLSYVQSIVGSNNQLVTAGSLKGKTGEFSVKVPSMIDNVSDLLDFPISTNNGAVIKLRDVATIRATYKDISTIAKVNGKRAIVLEVSKRTGGNIIEVVKNVKELVEGAKKNLPSNLDIIFSQDQSSEIEDMVSELENGIVLAGLLVIIIIILTVGIKPAVLISMSLPVCFFACILILYASGFTLNIVVLFSLILTVGMVVDDAVVISEYADRKIIEGMNASDAFTNSAHRMFFPVFTSTLVKMVVFFPLLFWPGILGQFMKFMPITVITIMTCSLIFALILQPAIGSLMMRKHKPASEEEIKAMLAAENGDIKDLHGFTRSYALLLDKILNRPKTFIVSIFAFMIGIYGFFIFAGTGMEFFPDVDAEGATIAIRAPGNMSVFQKDDLLREIEDKIFDMKDEIKVFYSKAGDIGNIKTELPKDTVGVIQLEFVDWQLRRKSKVILEDVRKKVAAIDGMNIQIIAQQNGPKSTKPIEINISSGSNDTTLAFTNKLINAMATIGGFKDTEDSRPIPGIEWHVDVDRKLAAKYSLSNNDIGSAIRMITDNGYKISTYYREDVDDEIDIVVRLPEKYRIASEIGKLRIANTSGYSLPLSTFVKVTPSQRVDEIKRVDRKNVITIRSDVAAGALVDDRVKQIQKWLETNKDDGVEVTFKGDTEKQKETADFLPKAFTAALAMMFMIMLIQFNNFYHTLVVMSAVFLSTVGVLLGLILSWQPFGVVMCGVGVIALAGIVLNNNILFIDTYQRLRADGHDVRDSIIRSGIQRLRPILLTATTAVLGLLPMVFGLSFDFLDRSISYDSPSSQWWRQLSASIAGGLTFATVLTLFFTPCLLTFDRDKK